MLYEVANVTLRYGKETVLAIPSLTVDKGDHVALLGPNGSGKTSLLKLLDGLLVPTEGRILKKGKPIGKNRKETPRSVYLHQFPYLLNGSVGYNVAFGCRAVGVSERETRRRVRNAMKALGLEDLSGKSHASLSGGETQRVALARALACGAEILLLDEPTASADAVSVRLIERALVQAEAEGATIIFSTHDEDFARRLTARTIRLRNGRLDDAEGRES